MAYWIEDGDNQEHGLLTLVAAKRRARVLMHEREAKGELYPLVMILTYDTEPESAWHFDRCSGRWHVEHN